jgi:hypothetical protein
MAFLDFNRIPQWARRSELTPAEPRERLSWSVAMIVIAGLSLLGWAVILYVVHLLVG